MRGSSSDSGPTAESTGDRPGTERDLRAGLLDGLAVLLFCLGTLQLTWGIWFPGDPQQPADTAVEAQSEGRARRPTVAEADQRFHLWLVARNAYTLSHKPWAIFDAEPCYPAQHTLALGHPLISMGLLGVVPYLATGDPIATYHFVVTVVHLIAALAMYLLIKDWTASRVAGIAAGLLFAFDPAKAGDPLYFFIPDTSWAVLALLFGRRFFASGRWQDGLATALFCSLLFALDAYPLFSAAFVGLPLGIWMLVHYGVRNLRVGPTILSVAVLATAAYFVFGPYLELRDAQQVLERKSQWLYTTWAVLLPGYGMGWLSFGLAVLACVVGRKRVLAGITGDPRWALICGALLVAALATGGNFWMEQAAERRGEPLPISIPNFYALVARVVPGLGSVRVPAHLAAGVHLAVSVLAGLGVAAIQGIAPQRSRPYVAAALIALAYAAALWPGLQGLAPRGVYHRVTVAPSPESVEFYETLARLGNSGPLFEVPTGGRYAMTYSSTQVLLSAYHHRRTSGCFAAFRPSGLGSVRSLGAELPDPEAVAALRAMGFTTLVVHHPHGPSAGGGLVASLAASAQQPEPMLKLLHGTHGLTAFNLQPLASE